MRHVVLLSCVSKKLARPARAEDLNRMTADQVRAWSERVLEELRSRFDLHADRFTFLAGGRYRSHLLPHIRYADVPMEGLGIGKQLQFLTRALSNP